jgi:hypothetical protein
VATPNKQQLVAALEIIQAVGEAIQTLGRVPSGELYANLMGTLSFERYTEIVRILVNAGVVREERSGLLTWIGPVRRTV